MKKSGATSTKRSSPQTSVVGGTGTSIYALALFLSAAVLATPVAYGNDAYAPVAMPDETLVETQQDHDNSTRTSSAPYSDKTEKAIQEPTRLLDSAIEEWPVQTLDLGLCDGS